jgi:hypothetical protein
MEHVKSGVSYIYNRLWGSASAATTPSSHNGNEDDSYVMISHTAPATTAASSNHNENKDDSFVMIARTAPDRSSSQTENKGEGYVVISPAVPGKSIPLQSPQQNALSFKKLYKLDVNQLCQLSSQQVRSLSSEQQEYVSRELLKATFYANPQFLSQKKEMYNAYTHYLKFQKQIAKEEAPESRTRLRIK